MYLNDLILVCGTDKVPGLIATYDVFEYIVGMIIYSGIHRLIATYDVFEYNQNNNPINQQPRLIATYDVFEYSAWFFKKFFTC